MSEKEYEDAILLYDISYDGLNNGYNKVTIVIDRTYKNMSLAFCTGKHKKKIDD